MLTQELVAEALDACDHNQTRAREWVRAKVNQLIGAFEPGVTLNNANIQIVGLPV